MVSPLVGALGAGLLGGYMNNRSAQKQARSASMPQRAAVAQASATNNWLSQQGVYKGPIHAAFRPELAQAGNMLTQSAGVGSAGLNAGLAGARTAQSFRPSMVTAGQTTARNSGAWTGDQFMSNYFNPFLKNVVGGMTDEAFRGRTMQINADEDKALAAGAYGGARHGVMDAETTRGFYDTLQRNAGNLYMQGFDKAAGYGMQDAQRYTDVDRLNADRTLTSDMGNADRTLSANQGNQRAGIEGARVNLDGSRLAMDVGNAQHANFLRSATALGDHGRYVQGWDQANLDRDKALWDEWRDIPVRQANIMSTAAGGGSIPTANGYQSFMQGAGLGMNALGMAGLWGAGSGSPNVGTGAVNSGWTSGGGYGAGVNPASGEYYGSLGF